MRFWIAAAALLGLAALGLATAPRVIDWSSYRPDIEAAASRLAGHEVTVSGPIEVTLLPRPMLRARDVAMSAPGDGTIGFELKANQADAALAFGPLLAGRAVLRDLRLRRPVLTIDDDSRRQLRTWPPRWQDLATPFSGLDLEAISIADGRIEFAGDIADDRTALNDLSLQLRMDGKGGPMEAVGLFRTRHQSFTMEADLGRADGNGVRAAKLTITAQNGSAETTELRFSGKVAPADPDQSLDGRLSVTGPDLQRGLDAMSAATGHPSPLRSIARAQPFRVGGRIEADRRGIRSDDLQLQLADKPGKGRIDLQFNPKTALDLDVELPTLRLADDAAIAGFLPLDLLSKLEVPTGDITLRLREVAYRDQAVRQARIKLVTGEDGITRIEQAKARFPGLVDAEFEGTLYEGRIGSRLNGQIAAVGDDLKRTLTWLDLVEEDDADGGWRRFSLDSAVDIDSVEIMLSAIDMRLGSSRLRGEAGLRFGERRRISLDVDVERPNLDLYAPNPDIEQAAMALRERFEGIDAEIAARFQRLIWGGVLVDEGVIVASAEDGRLTLDDVTLKTVGETSLTVNGAIDLDQSLADLAAEFSSTYPARALRHLEVDLPVNASRLRAIELRGALNGKSEKVDFSIDAGYDEGAARVAGEAGWIGDDPWYDLLIEASHPDHQALESQFGLAPLAPAGDAEGPFELAGRLRQKPATPWIASGNAKLGPTTFTGSLAFPSGGMSGPFEAKLSIGAPKKDSLAPFLIPAGLRVAGGWAPSRWFGRLPTVGLRTAWLERMEGSLALLSKGGLAGDGLEMDARLTDGLLYIEKLTASPWQGRLEAEVSLERRRDQPFAAVALDLKDVEAAELSAWLGVQKGIEGPLDLRLEASSIGRTPYEMMARVAGDLEIEGGPGLLEGLGVRELKWALAGAETGSALADRSFSLPFNGITAKASLDRGMLSFDEGRLIVDQGSDDDQQIDVGGTVDLLLWIADLTLTTEPGGETDEGSGLIFRVVGPPGRPGAYKPSGN